MKRYFTILILLCILSAACAMNGDGRAAKNLVTRADAEKIMGVPMKFEREKLDEKQTLCYYVDADHRRRLQVAIREYESEAQAKEAHEMTQDMNRSYFKVQPVEGVGDGAWIESRDYSLAIQVRRKNRGFLIIADGTENRNQKIAELRRVAQTVAARL